MIDGFKNPETMTLLANSPELSQQTKQRLQSQMAPAPITTPPVETIPLDQTEPAYTPPVEQPAPPQPQLQAPDLGGFDKITAAGQKALQLGAQAALEENKLAEGYIKQNDIFVKEQDDAMRVRMEKAEADQLKAQKLLDDLSSQQIDPNRVFKDMSTGQKIGTVLLAAIAGSRGADTIDRIVDNDIKSQTELKGSGIAAAKNAQSLYNDILAQHKDAFAAKSLLKASQLQAIQLKMNALASQTKNADFQMKLAGLYNDVEANKQKALNDFNERMQKVQAVNIDPNTAINQIQNKDDRERFVPGLGLVGTKEDAVKLKEKNASYYTAIDGIRDLKSKISTWAKIPGTKERAAAKTAIQALVGDLRVALTGPGPLTDTERAFVLDTIGDPSDWSALSSNTASKLNQLEKTLTRSRANFAKAYGVTVPPSASDLINPNRVK
jgi:hypothetical protein